VRYLKTVLLFLFLVAFSTALFSLEIHDAVRAGDLARVKALLEKDPGLVNAKAPNGKTPLFVACIEKKGLEMVRYLGDHGAEVNVSI
jgi:ankyrin repeat protein